MLKRIRSLLAHEIAGVLLIVLFGALLRLEGITNSPTDWHAFRQADTASVTREYVKHGIDLLHPTYQDLSNIQSGKDNLRGYRMVEFPFLNAIVAVLVRAVPFFDLVITSRVLVLLFSLGLMVALYALGKAWSDRWVGAAAALTFAVLPYARFYSRAILPEVPFIFFLTLSILGFEYWLKKKDWRWYCISALSLAAAALLKPFCLFVGLLYAVMALRAYGKNIIRHVELLIFVAIAVAPLYWWRKWVEHYPEGIPANSWLFNNLDGKPIRFRPAWFRWLYFERLTKLILGWFGVIPLIVGLLPKTKNWINYVAWWGSVLIYFSVIAAGNVRHDYYQVFILPILSLTVGLGVVRIARYINTYFKKKNKQSNVLSASFALLILGLAVIMGHRYVDGYYRTRPDWETAGRAVDRLLPENAKVIAPAFGDTAFLFQTNRTGWPIGFEIDKKIQLGAEYYVTTSYDDEARELEKKYTTIEKTADYLILDLQKPTVATSSARKP